MDSYGPHADFERLAQPFLPLVALFGDRQTAEYFSERSLAEAWLEVERALAEIQGELGVIPSAASEAIAAATAIGRVNFERLRKRTATVGYPILPLLQEINATSPPEVAAYIHWGATTQDIMDTGLTLQIGRALGRFERLLLELGDVIAAQAEAYRSTTMAGRTHAQQAVPTTLGAKLAVWLGEIQRHLERLRALRPRLLVVQLFGAGGTAAALGPSSREIRHRLAARLDLGVADVPWHTARDSLAEAAFVLAAVASTCGKFAGEVIDLSRSEIGELREAGGWHRGASSTMPQKANPILSEAVVGMSALAKQQVPAMLTAMQAGHERAAGEWQIEWDALPLTFTLAAGCVECTHQIIEGLQAFPERMRANLAADGGMIMAEAVMIHLAPLVGRARAHDLVYAACAAARNQEITLIDSLRQSLDQDLLGRLPPLEDLLSPETYLGEAQLVVGSALDEWSRVQQRVAR